VDEYSGHDHEHAIVDIAETDDFAVYDEVNHGMITIDFLSRGISVRLSRDEALGLAEVMADVAEYIRHSAGGRPSRLPA
jgi:hypothetical protein